MSENTGNTKYPFPPRWYEERIRALTDELNGAIELAQSQGHDVTVYDGPLGRRIDVRVRLRDDRAATESFDPAD